ncbi:MAG TPA: hypothetical protein ENI05_15560, partial [Porticoccus sp.]|nr:hypothetical protein [Porticoccus sp.]
MRFIPLLFVLLTIGTVGCATTSLEELTAEAKECVTNTHSVSDQGIVGDPTPEQKTACWADANKKLESMARQEKMREERQGPSCGKGWVAWCDWKGCVCIEG